LTLNTVRDKQLIKKQHDMKNILMLITIAALSFSTSLSANTIKDPVSEKNYIFKNQEVELSLDNQVAVESVVNVDYKNSFISIETKIEIAFLQVVNPTGEIEYQLPIGSTNLNLSSEDFTKGVYKLNLLLSDGSEFVSTTLEKF